MEISDLANPKFRIFTFCEKIIVDKSDRFSLINIFDAIHFTKFPGLISCSAFLQLFLPPGNYDIKVQSIDPDNAESEFASQTLVRESPSNHNLVMNLNLSFNQTGKYTYQVFVNNAFLCDFLLQVFLHEPADSKE